MVANLLDLIFGCVRRRGTSSPVHFALDSSMISGPSNFVHLSHLGVDDFGDEKALQSFNSFTILIEERKNSPCSPIGDQSKGIKHDEEIRQSVT